MLKPKKRWKIPNINDSEINEIALKYSLSPIIAKLLHARGITGEQEIKKFFKIDKADFYDPFLLDGMAEAVKRIQTAIIKNEKILIYGDYDADGVTSTSILYKTFKKLGANFDYYIPNRFTEGYGLNKEAIIKAEKLGFKVVITVDTGISATEEALLANDLGISLIITDHHEPPDILPEAYAIINPKKPNDNYPFKALAGAGVAFKLAHALLGDIPEDLLDITAVGTIADLVPLIGENRIIASLGLQKMNNTTHLGLRILLEKTGLLNKEINSGHIGFLIAPRINASGRLDSATNAVKLFITNHQNEAVDIVSNLEKINQERQAQVDNIIQEAEALISFGKMENDKVIVVAEEDWNVGVIGIVASRILDKYYRPTIILSIDSEKNIAKGSARSIEGFDIYQALSTVKDLLPHYGGHPAAAGLTINKGDIPVLREKLNILADKWLSEDDFIPSENVDVICDITDIDIQLIKEIERMSPFGIGNPKPKVLIENVEIYQAMLLGNGNNHLKLNVRNDHKSLEALYFRKGELFKDIAHFSKARLLGELSINEWNGQIKPQILIKDLHIADIQIFDWRNSNWKSRINELDLEKTAWIIEGDNATFDGDKRNLISRTYENWNNNDNDQFTSLALFHLPVSMENLKNIFKKNPQLERIYCIFDNGEKKNLGPYINRDIYKDIYLTLINNEALHNIDKAELYFKKFNINPDVFRFTLKVFEELEFIVLEEETMKVDKNPTKKELNESQIYRKYLEQNEINNIFINSSHQMLKKWFLKQILSVK